MNQEVSVERSTTKKTRRWRMALCASLILSLLVSFGLWRALANHIYFYESLHADEWLHDADVEPTGAPVSAGREEDSLVQSEIDQLRRELRSMLPRGIFIIIDTGKNRLYVKKDQQVLLEAVCSTGSGMLLRDPDGERQWIFDTPRGVFSVHRKVVDPVWTKPDWAFVEAGQNMPNRWSDRIDRESLGNYALYFGDGFMIHGTLCQRYLGRNITHGCVRLGDADLERVYEMTPVGSLIYIF